MNILVLMTEGVTKGERNQIITIFTLFCKLSEIDVLLQFQLLSYLAEFFNFILFKVEYYNYVWIASTTYPPGYTPNIKIHFTTKKSRCGDGFNFFLCLNLTNFSYNDIASPVVRRCVNP